MVHKLRNSAWHIQRVCTAIYQKIKTCTYSRIQAFPLMHVPRRSWRSGRQQQSTPGNTIRGLAPSVPPQSHVARHSTRPPDERPNLPVGDHGLLVPSERLLNWICVCSIIYFSQSFLELKNTIFFGTNYKVLLEMLPC